MSSWIREQMQDGIRGYADGRDDREAREHDRLWDLATSAEKRYQEKKNIKAHWKEKPDGNFEWVPGGGSCSGEGK